MDFSTVKTNFHGSQDDAFESLICLIVRRTDAANNLTWRCLHGKGGDGGVEAYWTPETGYKVGIQAKFFLKSAEIKWDQIESSFETALTVHSDLKEYRIYIACDLTGPTNRKTKNGVDEWGAKEKKLQDLAQSKGREIKILLKTASDIESALAHPNCVGLKEFYFDSIEITKQRLSQWLEDSIRKLGERYHPEDHVEVQAQKVFQALSRDPSFRDELLNSAKRVYECERLDVPNFWKDTDSKQQQTSEINSLVDRFEKFEEEFGIEPSAIWPFADWKSHTKQSREKSQNFLYSLFEENRNHEGERNSVHFLREKIHILTSALDDFQTLLNANPCKADTARVAFFNGEAGCGKSHLLAAAAQEILDNNGVAVLLLAQNLNDSELWKQIAHQLGFHQVNREEFLGALDAAAACTGQRAVIIIDALNEGGFRRQWRHELNGFIQQIQRFPHLAVAFSYRDVFEAMVLPDNTRKSFPVIEIQGFVTAAEQESAARAYLDKKGILRPPTPWMQPEFVNPLFLRTCSQTLHGEERREFPVGLHGTKEVLSFYLSSVADVLKKELESARSLKKACSAALKDLAGAMSVHRRDWLERSEACKIVTRHFKDHGSHDYFDLLLKAGVLRLDAPQHTSDDPLEPKDDVTRFAFQRFQDHLMVEALLAPLQTANDLRQAFTDRALLGFLLHSSGQWHWEWYGLLEAFSIQIPERFNCELVDVLPGGFEEHWEQYGIQAAFAESIRWRQYTCFTDRTVRLANNLTHSNQTIIRLLIEVAPRPKHPWNAEFLHRNLMQKKLPDRDRDWTVELSTDGTEDDHPAMRLVSWCATAAKESADPHVLQLSTLTLCWFLTSTARLLRDKTTKALSSLFTTNRELFPVMLERFAEVDDLYILERIMAAGYGSLVRFTDHDKAALFSTAVWNHFFSKEEIPPHLLLRDYACGIIEVAERWNAVPALVDLKRTKPPFKSKPPILNANKEQIERIAAKAGGKDILNSCDRWGDFYRYKVEHRIKSFLKVPLANSEPYSRQQRAQQFEKQIEQDPEKKLVLNQLQEAIISFITQDFSLQIQTAEDVLKDEALLEAWRAIQTAQKHLVTLLSREEKKLLFAIWLPERGIGKSSREEVSSFDSLRASSWIARRAYSMGWTVERFGQDLSSMSDYSRSRPRVERIGKKYQWLARSELLARLADNYWMKGDWNDEGSKIYAKATDIDFERDIDPTLFSIPDSAKRNISISLPAFIPPIIEIQPKSGNERLEWPFEETNCGKKAFARVLFSENDVAESGWYPLNWHACAEVRTQPRRSSSGHSLGQREFFFVHSVIVDSGQGTALAEILQKRKHICLNDWDHATYTDGPFFHEINKRLTWPFIQWQDARLEEMNFKIAYPVESYRWESHLDASLPEGMHTTALANWIIQTQGLRIDPYGSRKICTEAGELVAFSAGKHDESHGFLVKKSWFAQLLAESGTECVFLTVGEREAWRNGDQFGAATYRRYNHVEVIGPHGSIISRTWDEDQKNLE